MEHWTQTETPHTSEVEQGRLFAPPAETKQADPCDGCLHVGVVNCLACIETGGCAK